MSPATGEISTVALIERKVGISRSLFTRYWRDVHGVMAARIPGFESYTQYHVSALTEGSEPFEGIAVVTYASEADRQGLVTSEVTKHIHRDEQNAFRRALLYNLPPGASRVLRGGSAGEESLFIVVPQGVAVDDVADALLGSGPSQLALYDLTGGDPSGWNDTDADDGGQGRRFVAVLHAGFAQAGAGEEAARALAERVPGIAAYRADETYVMIEHGRPTPIGLRGLDAVRTIEEAGASNQLEEEVVRAVYGKLGTR